MELSCTIYRTSDVIGKRWILPILVQLLKDDARPKRYNELKESIPHITSKILSTRLKELEKEEIITKKTDASAFPVKCEYALTRKGIELIAVVKNLKTWSLKWNSSNKLCSSRECEMCEF